MKSRVTSRVPEWVKRAAEEFAARDGVSVNRFLTRVVAEKVGAQRAAFFAGRGMGGDADWAVAWLEGRGGKGVCLHAPWKAVPPKRCVKSRTLRGVARIR